MLGKQAKRVSVWKPRKMRLIEALESRVLLTTYGVTNTLDSGAGSLRQAILNANGNTGADIISFQIPGSGVVHTITPATVLPQITDPVTIDGSTEAGFTSKPLIQISGTSAGGADGLDIASGGCTIKDLAIGNFGGSAIALFTGVGNTIAGNYLGLDASGSVAAGNTYDGIYISGSSGNQITNNVISENGLTNQYPGIQIYGTGTNNNVMTGNLIGTDYSGSVGMGNGGTGILIQGGAQGNRVGTNGDGVNDAAERNVISGNGIAQNFVGIQIYGAGTNSNVVAGNYIGLGSNGLTVLGNGGVGVLINGGASNNRIGVNGGDVDAVAERNVISSNGYEGIGIFDAGTNSNVVAGNYVGTESTGLVARGNGGVGVYVGGGAQNNRIGTDGDGVGDALERNVIAANAYQGVALQDAGTSGNIVAGNYIGATASGGAMGNGNNGIWILNGATNNRIGTNGTDVDAAGEGNLVTANAYSGVLVSDNSTGNTIRGNSIHNNGFVGINLGDGVLVNHGTAAESGPNNLQNYPVLLAASPGAVTTVKGTLTAAASTTYKVDFYANSAADSPYSDTGDRWLGTATVTTDVTGKASFTANVGASSSSEWVTATATDSSGNTSEYSLPVKLPTVAAVVNGTTWTPIGPAPIMESDANAPVVTGRVSVIAVDPTNSNVMYLGADGGGIWKTTDWLDPIPHWTPLTDNMRSLNFDNISYTALAVAASSPSTVYAAVSGPGGGILKTTNGGTSWTELANAQFNYATFGTLIVDPTNANVVYVSTWFGATSGGGVYKSTDGGSTWTNTTASIRNGPAADMVMDPTNSSILYVGLAGDGLATDGIYKTVNGGTSWSLMSNGTLSGTAVGVSIRLTISKSSPLTLYATVFDPALGNAPDGAPHRYKTTNGGTSWTALGALSDVETRYWHALLAVDPTNPNIVYVNGDHSLYQSTDGGSTWVHEYDEDPINVYFDDTGAVVMTGDRGIYRWTGGSAAFQNKQGDLQDAEFYTLTLDPNNPAVTYGIAQDQVASMGSTGSGVWNYLGGGDEVGKILVDPTNSNRIYDYDPNNGTSFIYQSDDAGATYTAMGTGIPTTLVGYNLAYTSQNAFAMDPSNSNRLLVGTDTVYETTNAAGSWTAISPQLDGGQLITAIGIGQSNRNVVYAATQDGRMFVTQNDATWFEEDVGLPIDGYNHVMSIQVDPTNALHAFVVTGAFVGGRSGANHVFVTTNGGANWTNITGDLPIDDAGQGIAVDWRATTPILFVGTLRGLFVSTNLGVHWASFGAGLPNSVVTDVEYTPKYNLLAVSTYGRGAFEILAPTSVTTATTYIRLDSTGANIQIYNAATPTGTPTTFPVGSVSTINVSPATGSDLLVIDYSNGDPVPSGGIIYTGGGSSSGDTLQLIGATAADAFTLNAGSVGHGSGTVTYSNVLSLTLGTGIFTAGIDLNLLGVAVNAQTILNATTTEHIGQLSVNAGGTATLKGFFGNMIVNGSVQFAANGTNAATSALNNLLLAGSTNNWTGRLDITNDKLIVETTSGNKAATLAMLRNEVLYGLTHSTGIVSTGLPAHTIIAVIDAALTTLTAFGGVGIDANSILIGPELAGDANLDGLVSQTDLSTVLNNFGAATPNWTSGNFDYATTVDLTDLGYVLNDFGLSISNPSVVTSPMPGAASSPAAAVPADLPPTPPDDSNSVPGTILTCPVAIPGGAESEDDTPPDRNGSLLPKGDIVPTGVAPPVVVASSAPVVTPTVSIVAPPMSTVAPPARAPVAALPMIVPLPSFATLSLRSIKPEKTVAAHSAVRSPHIQAGPKIGTVTYTLRGRMHVFGVGDRKRSLDLARPDV